MYACFRPPTYSQQTLSCYENSIVPLCNTVQFREERPEQVFQDLVFIILRGLVLFILLVIEVRIPRVDCLQCLRISSKFVEREYKLAEREDKKRKSLSLTHLSLTSLIVLSIS